MNPGRIETYTHSDGTTQNKGSCTVRVDCQTEFGAKTDVFKAFCKRAALLCYGAQSEIYADVIVTFPELEQERLDLEKTMQEKVTVQRIVIVTLMRAVCEKEPEPSALSKLLKTLPLKRVEMPLFEASQVTEPADLNLVDLTMIKEARFNPIDKNNMLRRHCNCGPHQECNVCGDTINDGFGNRV
jgi:hypothetical protein